jgi:membrane-associated protease RseP (regulator of RpoE activity)
LLNNGVRVLAVKPGGPAELAGLQKDDLVKSVDGKPVFTVDEMDALQMTTTPGQTWRLSVERAGKLMTLNVKLTARPVVTASDTDPGESVPGAAPPALTPPVSPLPSLTPPVAPLPSLTPPATTPPATPPPATVPGATTPVDPLLPANDPPAAAPGAGGPIRSSPAAGAPEAAATPSADTLPSPAEPAGGGASLGITVKSLTPEDIAAYGLVVRRGGLITAIRPGSPADTAGLPLGAVVVTIDGRRIDTADDLVAFVRAARPGQEVELGYMQGERMQRKTVRLAPTAVGVVPSAPPSAPGGLGLGLGGGGPLINRAERMVENLGLGPGRGGISSIYDPSEMAMLKTRVGELTEQVKALKERLDKLEGGPAGAPPPVPAP